ncbi:tRNA-uridine aminocarboxypropyltransferase [Rariglobus hedericola]|uniref:tRNA-uridine aminocarboxypropyltransferase n=1 Tax=Rariglobus hedericola TaxID=2597822 RepID=A0A556QMR6_9BACT|nr:tRNA-uridine aminocarboxypropyltransferase [Rariglobus hedericola]TSJ77892.1 DTW domain-containing protein [Rariglobus hedericola]
MSREMCYRCFWPKPICWCPSITPMETRTRFVFLMHPHEFKHEKAATGRLTHLCLANSELQMGLAFDDHESVQEIINDPQNFVMLVYPSVGARNLSKGDLTPADLGGRRLVVFLLDATWSGAKKMLRLSPSLQRLPRLMFTPTALSRYVIKQQPVEGCLSTLEASHELLLALQRSGLDDYPLPDQLLDLFARMQDYQLKCASDPTRQGYRRNPYSTPASRKRVGSRTQARRTRVLNLGTDTPPTP